MHCFLCRRDELDFVNSNIVTTGEQQHQTIGYDQNYHSSTGNGYDTYYGTGEYAENPFYYSHAENADYYPDGSDVKSYGYGAGF